MRLELTDAPRRGTVYGVPGFTIRTDKLHLRLAGTALGLFFLVIGGGSIATAQPVAAEQALPFAIMAIVAGVAALGFAWLEAYPERVFCRPLRRPGHRLAGPPPDETEQAPLFETVRRP